MPHKILIAAQVLSFLDCDQDCDDPDEVMTERCDKRSFRYTELENLPTGKNVDGENNQGMNFNFYLHLFAYRYER